MTSTREDLETDLARLSIQLTFVAYHAWDMVNAVAITLARLVSRRGRFLQWETAAAVAQRTRKLDVKGFYDSMRSSPAIATIGLVSVALFHPAAFPAASQEVPSELRTAEWSWSTPPTLRWPTRSAPARR